MDQPIRPGAALPKTPTHIRGFDAITDGGLPTGRPTLICGSAGCGKTLFGMEFLVRGASEAGEPGVLFSFEEREGDIAANVASLGFDVAAIIERDLFRIDEIKLDAAEIAETGDYSLDGLFLRLQATVDEIGAKRVVLDTVENLFAALSNHKILRSELNRLFRWLKDRNLTAVITAERGRDSLTRYGIEEYVSDCVIMLDHRVSEQVSTRRLRILKYRGSSHGTNEYPFMIDDAGFSIVPITSARMEHAVFDDFVTTGEAGLDQMLDGRGYHRGSTVLLSGTSGTGKSTLAFTSAAAAAKNGEPALVFSFEESAGQIVRNMRSIGLDLQPLLDTGLLRLHTARPSLFGLEQHLFQMLADVEQFNPALVVVDPASCFSSSGSNASSVSLLLIRLIDALKERGCTAVLTYLNSDKANLETTVEGISSLADTWVLLDTVQHGGERNRTIHILKSRGMNHSNQICEFTIGSDGLVFTPPYLGPDESVLTGAARVAQEARELARLKVRQAATERKKRALDRLQRQRDGEVAALMSRFDAELDSIRQEIADAEQLDALAVSDQKTLTDKSQSNISIPSQRSSGS